MKGGVLHFWRDILQDSACTFTYDYWPKPVDAIIRVDPPEQVRFVSVAVALIYLR